MLHQASVIPTALPSSLASAVINTAAGLLSGPVALPSISGPLTYADKESLLLEDVAIPSSILSNREAHLSQDALYDSENEYASRSGDSPTSTLTSASAPTVRDTEKISRPKRKRISPMQLETLVNLFAETDTPTYEVREAVGQQLGMSNREVQVGIIGVRVSGISLLKCLIFNRFGFRIAGRRNEIQDSVSNIKLYETPNSMAILNSKATRVWIPVKRFCSPLRTLANRPRKLPSHRQNQRRGRPPHRDLTVTTEISLKALDSGPTVRPKFYTLAKYQHSRRPHLRMTLHAPSKVLCRQLQDLCDPGTSGKDLHSRIRSRDRFQQRAIQDQSFVMRGIHLQGQSCLQCAAKRRFFRTGRSVIKTLGIVRRHTLLALYSALAVRHCRRRPSVWTEDHRCNRAACLQSASCWIWPIRPSDLVSLLTIDPSQPQRLLHCRLGLRYLRAVTAFR